MFLTRGFEDEVLLIAMALLLDAYMQWFHIGSYRLAGHFSQRGGLVPRQVNKISQLMQGFLLISN
jgi:hypothetical protein